MSAAVHVRRLAVGFALPAAACPFIAFSRPGFGALFRGLLGGALLGTRDLALLLAGIALHPIGLRNSRKYSVP